MKKVLLFFLPLFIYTTAISQNLIIKGRVRCLNQSAHSTKGAENIIVVPTFKPSKSALTATSPSGYFEFNTGTPLAMLRDKQVNVYVVSGCGTCKDIVKRVFISEDQDRQNRDDSKSYVTIKNWVVSKNCSDIELASLKADSVLQLIQQQPEQKLTALTNVTAVTGTPALLNLLTTLTTVLVPVPPATGIFEAVTLREGDIHYGRFLQAATLTHSSSVGFNFAPHRDLSDAPFWNPSAIPFSTKSNNISLLTNVKNNGKLSGFFRLNERLSIGAGTIYTRQDEFRDGDFERREPRNLKLIDSVIMNLEEYAVFVSPAYKINKAFSIGASLKSIWQKFNSPVQVDIQRDAEGNDVNTFTHRSVKKQAFDVDLSFTYKVSKALQVGVNAMNLAGTTLYGDAFTPRQTTYAFQSQRSLGLGATYKWQRFNVGTDVLLTEDGLYDAALGVNYVPFNEALLSAGYAFKQESYSIGLRLKHFRLTYINDNDFLANEKRKGKSNFLNGRLYSGFSFYF